MVIGKPPLLSGSSNGARCFRLLPAPLSRGFLLEYFWLWLVSRGKLLRYSSLLLGTDFGITISPILSPPFPCKFLIMPFRPTKTGTGRPGQVLWSCCCL